MNRIIMITSILILCSCTSNNDFEKGKKQLEQQGYTNVKDTGYKLLGCDEKDIYRQGFEAVDSKGDTIEGYFCSGIFKGVTVRIK